MVMAFAMMCTITAKDLTGVKIYLNPGHGGYWNGANSEDYSAGALHNDRNIATIPFELGDQNGFWESSCNLVKGLYLKDLLEKAGATVMISRTQNREEDDRDLKLISQEANDFGANFLLSIHSNAGGAGHNYLLTLYNLDKDGNGKDQTAMDLSKKYAGDVIDYLDDNQVTVWTVAPKIMEDNYLLGYTLGILRHLNVPGFVLEGSFHDYLPETHRLLNKDYATMSMDGVYRFICHTFGADMPTTGDIAGTVKDSKRIMTDTRFRNWAKGSLDRFQPLNGAKITLSDSQGKALSTYTTDQYWNGFYIFRNLAPGSYKVKMEAEGYTTQEKDVTVSASTTTNFVTLLEDPSYVEPPIVIGTPNIFASDLKATLIDEGKYQIDFVLNTDATSVKIKFYHNDALVKEVAFDGVFVKGHNSVVLNSQDLPNIDLREIKWALEVSGETVTPNSAFTDSRVTSQQFVAPVGIAIDNNQSSPYFGRIYVSESIGKKTNYDRTTTDGIYILDPTLSDVTGQGNTAYNGNVTWANNAALTSCASPMRLAMDEEGYVFITDWSDSHSGIWVMNPAKPSEAFKDVFAQGTRDGNGILSIGGVNVHGSVCSATLKGKGANRVLYTHDEDLSVGPLQKYAIGDMSTPFSGAPVNIPTGSYTINKGVATYMVADKKGGFWVSQYRGGQVATYPALMHFNEAGEVDFSKAYWDGARNYSFAINESQTKLVAASGSTLYVNDLSYDANGVPSLTENTTIAVADVVNPYALAFDAADNLYLGCSTGVFWGMAMPKTTNSYETKAIGAFSTVSAVDAVNAATLNITLASNTLNISSNKSLGNVVVYSTVGEVVYQAASLESNDVLVDVSGWSNGMYLVKVNNKVVKVLK